MWRVGDAAEIADNILPDNVIPSEFPQWQKQMNQFGELFKQCAYTTSEMLALGLGWEQNTLRSLMEGGTQLMGPTGSDLKKYNTEGDILAGFHYGNNL